MLQNWAPFLTTMLGTNGAVYMLARWRWERRKSGADTAAVFTTMAETLASRAEKTALRAEEDNEKLREQNEKLHEEVRALREEVRELRPLRAEVEELRRRMAQMQRDVSATRIAIEHSTAEEVWSLPEAQEPQQREGRDRP